MAHTMACGDSRAYFRTQAELAQQQANAFNLNQSLQAYQSQMASGSTNAALSGLYQNAYAPMRNITPEKQPKSPDKVIADCGFGGAESRPRSRRRRKAVLASIPVAGE